MCYTQCGIGWSTQLTSGVPPSLHIQGRSNVPPKDTPWTATQCTCGGLIGSGFDQVAHTVLLVVQVAHTVLLVVQVAHTVLLVVQVAHTVLLVVQVAHTVLLVVQVAHTVLLVVQVAHTVLLVVQVAHTVLLVVQFTGQLFMCCSSTSVVVGIAEISCNAITHCQELCPQQFCLGGECGSDDKQQSATSRRHQVREGSVQPTVL